MGNGEAKADLQFVLSERKAEEDMSICHLEKQRRGIWAQILLHGSSGANKKDYAKACICILTSDS